MCDKFMSHKGPQGPTYSSLSDLYVTKLCPIKDHEGRWCDTQRNTTYMQGTTDIQGSTIWPTKVHDLINKKPV